MSKISIQSFKEKTAELYQDYQSGFAGRARATRSLEALDAIIQSLAALIEEARGDEELRNLPSFADSLETAIENLNLYKTERDEIAKAKANPLAVKAAEALGKVERLSSIYGRCFAGQNRATRDARLLEEVVTEIEATKKLLESYCEQGESELKDDIANIESQLELYRNEVNEIRSAVANATPEDRISILAQLANSQFAIYNAQFAEKSRLTRRPELLSRMINNLEDYRKQMRAIQEMPSVTSPVNTNNINIVTDNINLYKNELEQIKSARANTSPAELSGELANAANAVMAEYREHFAGQMRATRDITKLSNMCDALKEISQQMEELLQHESLTHNVTNLVIVNESWGTYEREYVAVREAIQANNPA